MRPLCVGLYTVLGALMLSGCASNRETVLDSGISQVAIRSYQSRAFDTTDRLALLRAVVATLQDLEFIVEDADARLGMVSAKKANESWDTYHNQYIRITVSIRPKGTTQLLVRASLEHRNKPVHKAEPYQQFFAALQKTVFLVQGAERTGGTGHQRRPPAR